MKSLQRHHIFYFMLYKWLNMGSNDSSQKNWYLLIHFLALLANIMLTKHAKWLHNYAWMRTRMKKNENSFEPPHDQTNKMSACPAKTQINLGICPIWSESSPSAWRKLGSLATHWAHSEDSDQTGRMPRLIWVFAGHTVILLVLSWGSSFRVSLETGQVRFVIYGVRFLCSNFQEVPRTWKSRVPDVHLSELDLHHFMINSSRQVWSLMTEFCTQSQVLNNYHLAAVSTLLAFVGVHGV